MVTRRSLLKTFCAFAALAIAAPVAAQIPPDYFDTVDPTNATTLRTTLHTRLRTGAIQVGYSNTWEPIKRIWQDPFNSSNVIMIYTGDSRPKSAQCSTACEDGSYLAGVWSREHVWPQSSFNSLEPMRSDLHALFPCDQDLNNRRGNKPFNNVLFNNMTLPSNGNEDNTQFFSPRPADRGDIARALLYMDVRYEGTFGERDLVLNDAPGGAGANQCGILSTLLRWHCEDPPDAFEIARNHQTYNEQGNANPFISRPEWVPILWGYGAGTDFNTFLFTPADAAPATTVPNAEAPFIRISGAANANEWLLYSLDVTQIGTVTDAQVEDIRLYHDADNSGTVTTGDTLLARTTLSGGTGTIIANSFPFETTTRHLLLTVKLRPTAPVGGTVRLRLNANSLVPSPCGGNDIPPAFANFDSGTTTIITGSGPTGGVIISEIMYNPNSSEAAPNRVEWVELYNTGSAPVTLTNARLRDDDGQTGTFSVTMAPLEAVVIAPQEVTESQFKAAWPGTYQLIRVSNWGSGGLNNLTNSPPEPLELINAANEIIDAVTYNNVAPWPIIPPDGPSIYVLPAFLNASDNDNGSSWARSQVGVHGAVANIVVAPFTGNDVGSPGVVVALPPPTGAPVIGSCSNAVEDTPGPLVLNFTDADDQPASAFTATASAPSAGSISPTGTIAKTGTGTYTATFSYTPAPDDFGTRTFSVSINDGTNTTNGTVTFFIEPVNDAPTITAIADQTISISGSTGPLAFTLDDVDSVIADIAMSALSSNTTVIPNANITFTGTGANRFVTVAGAPGESGVSVITLFAEDAEGAIESTEFTVTVTGMTSTGDNWILYQ